MKKTVLAFAVAAAMGVPAVAAADTTLYGRFNVSLDHVDDGANKETLMTNNSTRWGIRGSEDLGGGLKGVFQIESAVGFAGNSSTDVGGRNTYVGLGGDFGEVRLGRHDTAYKLSTLRMNFFADTNGDMYNVFGTVGGGATTGETGFYDRQDNTIFYQSPNINGFSAMATYSMDSSVASNEISSDGKKVLSLAGTYAQGPMVLMAAYQKKDEAFGAGEDGVAWKIGGTYVIDDVTLTAGYENIDNDTNSRGAFHLGARYSLGQTYLMASYTQANDLVSDDGAKMYALGAGYNLSRRTGVYAVYAQLKNDSVDGLYNMNKTGSGNGFNIASGEDTAKSFQVGVWHNF
ncbi:Outer membrane protein (porin) [Ectothiorhodosinus mongolicus]|uniref:Outer membrane protein (Porin) n=1 Tax=Ectothiorhodosinus mongolicus TaxID=233100 RepID=A0A1R3W7B6_9GAMM|nr:porin [Ectothiorhodosinus mongolicus]ULX57400.1 porin [Ectothiorhodosinus mongolicus]SIT72001.1 Outer membrane protein (porin) [Ectothiorhodosinus mongolicus]